jgi:Cys-tRNA(Pro)/Cys-tRNA(Cys) deacylase
MTAIAMTSDLIPGRHPPAPRLSRRNRRSRRDILAGMANPALSAIDRSGIRHRVIRHGPVRSLAEAAAARGVEPADVIKTLVVRRGDDDFLFVLVPGDRTISWPKLRALLGVSRLSMPDAEMAREATGYERGTITPFGSTRSWPVIADERVSGRMITVGAGEHGVAVAADADELVRVLHAQVADVTDPEPPR